MRTLSAIWWIFLRPFTYLKPRLNCFQNVCIFAHFMVIKKTTPLYNLCMLVRLIRSTIVLYLGVLSEAKKDSLWVNQITLS